MINAPCVTHNCYEVKKYEMETELDDNVSLGDIIVAVPDRDEGRRQLLRDDMQSPRSELQALR